MRFATKNSAKNIKRQMRPVVQRLIAPKERAIKNIIGPKAKTAE